MSSSFLDPVSPAHELSSPTGVGRRSLGHMGHSWHSGQSSYRLSFSLPSYSLAAHPTPMGTVASLGAVEVKQIGWNWCASLDISLSCCLQMPLLLAVLSKYADTSHLCVLSSSLCLFKKSFLLQEGFRENNNTNTI